MNLDKIRNIQSEYQETLNNILSFIGYNSHDFMEIEILENSKWNIVDDNLYLQLMEDSDDVYDFIISSYSAQGKKLFMKKDDTYTYIMAYDEEDNYDDTSIFIVQNCNFDSEY